MRREALPGVRAAHAGLGLSPERQAGGPAAIADEMQLLFERHRRSRDAERWWRAVELAADGCMQDLTRLVALFKGQLVDILEGFAAANLVADGDAVEALAGRTAERIAGAGAARVVAAAACYVSPGAAVG